MNQIVCLSTSNWHPQPTRKQQVMSRLQNAQILYFDPPVSLLAPLKDKSAKSRLSDYKRAGEVIKEGLTVYALPPVWPFFNKFRLINKINQRRQARFVRKTMKRHGFEKPVLWCYSPSSADLVGRVPHKAVVYDCVDRHSAYKGMISPKVVDKMERELAGGADMVFCTATGLEQTLRQYNPETHLIPNGAAYEMFSKAAQPQETLTPPPNDLFNVKNPVFGFAGALQECIDYELVAGAAKARPDWSFVFIGRVQPGVDVSALEALPNVHLLGLKPYRDIPSYLQYFDVCLNIFRSGDLAKDVSPLKFYEYLATGKPIVSTPQPLQVNDYAELIYIAQNAQDFIPQCEAALAEHSAWKVGQRMQKGKAASWTARVGAMEALLGQKGIFGK